ncbi:MAG: PH domain-containing protein [bacterium]|nr:PH domain-containing protein [bacterium]
MFDLDQNETMVKKVRQHKLVLFFNTFFLVIFVVAPPFLYYLAGNTVYVPGDDLALFFSIYSAILLFAWAAFFKKWTDYYLDVLIITDMRVIDIEQKGFFSRDIATISLDKIQDITVNINGVLATFLDFGTLKIQSAGEMTEFVIRDIPNPNKIKSIIYELHVKRLEAPQSVKVVQ